MCNIDERNIITIDIRKDLPSCATCKDMDDDKFDKLGLQIMYDYLCCACYHCMDCDIYETYIKMTIHDIAIKMNKINYHKETLKKLSIALDKEK